MFRPKILCTNKKSKKCLKYILYTYITMLIIANNDTKILFDNFKALRIYLKYLFYMDFILRIQSYIISSSSKEIELSYVMTSQFDIEISWWQLPHMTVQICKLSVLLTHFMSNRTNYSHYPVCGFLSLLLHGRQTLINTVCTFISAHCHYVLTQVEDK